MVEGVEMMPYVKFICVKCGYKLRCEAKTYSDEFRGKPAPPLCFEGFMDENGDDRANFEYIECKLDED